MKPASDLDYERLAKAIKEIQTASNFQNDLETLLARTYKAGWDACWQDTLEFKYAISSKGSEKKDEDLVSKSER
jgi:hypothetical protein